MKYFWKHEIFFLKQVFINGLLTLALCAFAASGQISKPQAAATPDKAAQAEAISAAAIALFEQGTAESMQAALAKFEAARRLYEESGSSQGAAYCLVFEGRIYFALGEMQKALDSYNPALPLLKIIDDKSALAVTLNNIGAVYRATGEKQKALDFYNQALPIYKSVGDRDGEANSLNSIGLVFDELGEKQKALDFYNQSLPLFKAGGNKSGEAITLNNIGKLYSNSGEKQKALEFYNLALPLHKIAGSKGGEAMTLGNIGSVYSSLGEQRKALDYFLRAFPLLKEIGDQSGAAIILNNVGGVYRDLGENQKAFEFFNLSLPFFRAVGNKEGEASALGNIGLIYNRSDERPKALEYYNLALPLYKIIGDKDGEATTLTNIGSYFSSLNENQKALEYFNRALPLYREIGNRRGEAIALNNIGGVYDDLGETGKALDFYASALPIHNANGDKSAEATTLNNLLYLWNTLGNRRLAVFYGKQAIGKYRELRRNIRDLDKETQQIYLKTIEKTYRKLAETLIFENRLPEAQQVLNSFKDQQFFDFDKTQAKQAEPLALSPREADFAARYEKAAASGEFNTLLKQAEADFSQPVSAKDKVGAITDVEQMQTTLRRLFQETGQKAVAVYQLLGEDDFHALVITPDAVSSVSVPVKNTLLNERALQFWGLLQTDKYDPTRLGAELYDTIFKSLETKLPKDTKTILWSLDGNLRYIPMAALYDGERKQYLVERFNHVNFTRADSERMTRAVKPVWTALGLGSSAAHTIELLGDTVSFNALPGVGEELRLVLKQTGKPDGIFAGETLTDARFTKRAMLDALEKHRPLVHIASHFAFAAGDEARSFLLLGDGSAMTLAEMKQQPNLFAGVELLTLSACNTAAQRMGNGREVDAFSELAQRLGAGAVLATLWSVADNSTPELMRGFYDLKLNGHLTKAEALRQSQLALLSGTSAAKPLATRSDSSRVKIVVVEKTEDKTPKTETTLRSDIIYLNRQSAPPFVKDKTKPFAHPFYWSPFILFGNWR